LRQLREADKLGKNLMLQMDNCWCDNKNKWFLGFLSHLVAFGWFDSVEIFYLRPGHSHGIVDSMCFAPLGRDTCARFIYWTPDQFWAHHYSQKGTHWVQWFANKERMQHELGNEKCYNATQHSLKVLVDPQTALK
jgi:hypothetical protein